MNLYVKKSELILLIMVNKLTNKEAKAKLKSNKN